MTPAEVPERIERVMGCTPDELRGWLARALPGAGLTIGQGTALASFDDGALRLRWHALPERRIALLAIPSLAVTFEFESMTPVQRHAVLRRFDLATQRGGG